jgi:hypothetical protein
MEVEKPILVLASLGSRFSCWKAWQVLLPFPQVRKGILAPLAVDEQGTEAEARASKSLTKKVDGR